MAKESLRKNKDVERSVTERQSVTVPMRPEHINEACDQLAQALLSLAEAESLKKSATNDFKTKQDDVDAITQRLSERKALREMDVCWEKDWKAGEKRMIATETVNGFTQEYIVLTEPITEDDRQMRFA